MSAAMGIFVKDSRMRLKEFKTAVVFEPSVFEAQKFYCNSQHCATVLRKRELIIQKTDRIKKDIKNKTNKWIHIS